MNPHLKLPSIPENTLYPGQPPATSGRQGQRGAILPLAAGKSGCQGQRGAILPLAAGKSPYIASILFPKISQTRIFCPPAGKRTFSQWKLSAVISEKIQ